MSLGLLGALLACALLAFAVLYFGLRRLDRRNGTGYRLDLLTLALLAALTAGFFWQVLFVPGMTMPVGGGDMASFMYPVYSFVARALAAGELPLWNPYLYLGMPFAADVQTALFYPPNWPVFLLLPRLGYTALELFVIAHYVVGAATAYALARELAIPRLGAIAAGIVFAFSGFAVAHLGHVNMLATVVWLPLVMLLARRAVRRTSLGYGVLAALVVGLTFLAGHPQLFLYQTALALAFVVYDLLLARPERDRLLKGLTLLAFVPALAVVLAGVQAVPSFELMRHSVRADISYAGSTEYSVAPVGLVALVLPHFFGPNAANYWGYWGSTGNLTEVYGYAGLIPLALAALAVFLRRDRWTAFFVGLAVLALILSLGGHTIVQGWVYRFVPGMDKFRAYGRFLFFFDFAVAILAGRGVALLLALPSWRERPAVRLVVRVLAVAFGGLLLLGAVLYYSRLPGATDDPAGFERIVTILNDIAFALLLLLLGLGLIVAWRRRVLRPAAAGALAVGLVVLDLFSANARYNPTDADILANLNHPAILEYLRQDPEPFRIDSDTGVGHLWSPNTSLLHGLYDVRGIFNPMMLADVQHHWATLGGRSGKLYDLLNAKYVVGAKDVVLDWDKFELATDADPRVNLYRNPDALPRAFVVGAAQYVASAEEAWQAIHAPDFDPAAKVIVTGEGESASAAATPARPATIVKQTLNEVVIEVEAGGEGGYLVLSEAFYPGWRAFVDGAETAVLRADYVLRAVQLPPGAKQVRMVYEPASWRVGLATSALGWVVVVAVAAYCVWRATRRRALSPRTSLRGSDA